MQSISNIFQSITGTLSRIEINDAIDILIVAFLIYKVIGLIRKTSSYSLAKGLLVVLVALWLSGIFKLTVINYILRKTVEIGLIALIILFQPELRKLLSKMGARSFSGIFSPTEQNTPELESAINQTVMACVQMSESKTGALIMFERDYGLNDIMATGTSIDSEVSSELLKNIFFPNSPLHDGALIIKNSRIASAGCVLPLTSKTNLSKDLGMRHRAGIGASEQSDAVVIIVSEETGSISVAIEGMLKRNLDRMTFERILHAELVKENPGEKKYSAVFSKLFGKKGEGDEKEKNS